MTNISGHLARARLLASRSTVRRRRAIIAATIIFYAISAKAETLNNITQFAHNICGELPSGGVSTAAIKDKVQANAGLLAKLVTNSAKVTESVQNEVYAGIPFDKLPHDVNNVTQCKVELIKIILDSNQIIWPDKGNSTLTPVREYLRTQDIPPPNVGAYGLVVFQSKPTPANKAKLTMVCRSFLAFFPQSETSTVPMRERMMTIWPLDDPEAEKAKADDCAFILEHYDLNAAESAMNDARIQHATFDGEGPYLVGWSPSNSRKIPDKLVLVVDMSADNSQGMIDNKFLFWKTKIVENPELWRSGWSLNAIRVAIKEFADQYGESMLDAVHLSAKRP
jgi:hypothetical protein